MFFLVTLHLGEAFCIVSHHDCFFVVVVHFSLVMTLFCFISLGKLLAMFLWLY